MNILLFSPIKMQESAVIDKIVKDYGLEYIDFRSLFSKGNIEESALKLKIKDLIQKSENIDPEDFIEAIVQEALSYSEKGCVIRNVPTTIEQCNVFIKYLSKYNLVIDYLITLQPSEAMLNFKRPNVPLMIVPFTKEKYLASNKMYLNETHGTIAASRRLQKELNLPALNLFCGPDKPNTYTDNVEKIGKFLSST